MKKLISGMLAGVLLELVSMSVANAQASIDRIGTFNSPNSNSVQRSHPFGSRIYSNGVIRSRRGYASPSAVIKHGDGSTSFYYSNGTRVTVNEKKIHPTGAPLQSGAINGRLKN